MKYIYCHSPPTADSRRVVAVLQITLTTISTGTGQNETYPYQLFSIRTCINFGLAIFL